jgi:hypothetical protein
VLILLLLGTPVAYAQGKAVFVPPTISVATFRGVLEQAQSPALAEAEAIYQVGVRQGVDPAFLLAIFARESSYGTSTTVGRRADGSPTMNWANLACEGYPRCYNGRREYPSWTAGADDFAGVLVDDYRSQNLQTVESIIPVFAPASTQDTPGYIQQVLALMARWAEGTVAEPSPAPVGGPLDMDRWTRAWADGAWYDVQYQVGLVLWNVNLVVIQTALALRSVADLIPTIFAAPLNLLGTLLGDAAWSMVILALMLGALVLLFAPVGVQQRLVSFHAAPVILILSLSLLPVAGDTFAWIENGRRSLAHGVYRAMFETTEASLQEGQPDAPGASLGTITPLCPATGDPVLHGIDAAGAYLFALCTDLGAEDAFPARFTETFFPHTGADVQQVQFAERAEMLATGMRGIRRLFNGIGLATGGLLEEAIYLAIGVAMLLYALLLLAVFVVAVFRPYLGLLDDLLGMALKTFMWSGVVSIFQAFLMAWLFHAAATAPMIMVVAVGMVAGWGQFGLLLLTVFGLGWSFFRALRHTAAWKPLRSSMSISGAVRHRITSQVGKLSLPKLALPTVATLATAAASYSSAQARASAQRAGAHVRHQQTTRAAPGSTTGTTQPLPPLNRPMDKTQPLPVLRPPVRRAQLPARRRLPRYKVHRGVHRYQPKERNP